MRSGRAGVVGYVVARGASVAALSLAPMSAFAAMADLDAGTELSAVVVAPEAGPMRRDLGLSTLPSSAQDTPQAIQVIGAEQLRAQGVSSLEQALRNVPGITIAIGEGGTLNGDQFKIRGFDAKDDVYVDGLRDFGVYTRDSFAYEEVQVLKGPSGAMFGRGTTGGVINTVSKTPALRDFASVDAYAGSGDDYRGLVDVNRRLGDTAAVRINLMGTRAGVNGRDLTYSHRWGLAAAVGFGLGTDRTFTFNVLHQQDHRIPDYGIVIGQPTGSLVAQPLTEYGLDRRLFEGFATDRDRTTADVVTARYKAAPMPWLTLTSDSRVGVYSRYFQYTTVDGCFTDPVTHQTCADALLDGDAATKPIGTIGGGGPYRMHAWGAQNITTARIEAPLGRFRNQFIAGFDASYQNNHKRFFFYTLPQTIPGGYLPPSPIARTRIPVDLLDPSHAPPPGYAVFAATPANIVCTPPASVCSTATLASVNATRGDATDLAGFVTDRLWLTERLSVIGGVRFESYRAAFDSEAVSGAVTPVRVRSAFTNPRVSLVYEPSGARTYYLSWGRAATPQATSVVGAATAVALAAKDLAPEVSESFEAGAKVGLFHNRLTFTASLFDVRKDNATQVDPATGFLVAQSGERDEVRGLELGLSGRVTPAWTVSANYTHLDARVKEAFVNCVVPTSTVGAPTTVVCPAGVAAPIPVLDTVSIGRPVIFTPRDAASLFTTYDAGDLVPGLSFGGDVVFQSRMPVRYTAVSVSYSDRSTLAPLRIAEVPESITVDAFVAYRFGAYRVSLNVYNVGDRLNYTQVFGNRAIPAPRRTFILSLGASF